MNNTSGTFDFIIIGKEKIHCKGCEIRIGNALKRLSGVREVKASAKDQRVVVAVDPAEIGPDQVRDWLEQLGYQVTRGDV